MLTTYLRTISTQLSRENLVGATNSTSSDSNDALENWKNRMHEVSFRKCGLITQSLPHVATEKIELPVYEGLPELYAFFTVFEERV